MKNDGGPAFPGAVNTCAPPGMTLRDWFAGQALAGLLANSGGPIQSNEMSGWNYVNCGTETIASECYRLADAMIEERSK